MTASISLAKLVSRVAMVAAVGVVAASVGYLGLLLHTFRRYGQLLPED